MKKSKLFILIGIVITGLILVVLFGGFFIRNYIKKELADKTVGSYRIQSRKVDVNLFFRQIVFTDVVAEDTITRQILKVPEVKAAGIHILPLLFSDKAIVNNLQLNKAEVLIVKADSTQKNKKEKKAASQQEADIDFIRIKKLEVNEATLSFQDFATGKADTLFSIQAGIEVWNLDINSERQRLTFSDHSAERLEAKLGNARYYLPGGLYQMEFETLEFSSEKKALNLENLHLSSLYPRHELAKQTGVQTDWYDITLKQFEIRDIDMLALLNDTAVVFGVAVLEELDAEIFRDKRLPFPDKPDTKLPVQMLKSLPFALHTDSILIKNSDIVYQEISEGSVEPGSVSINKLYASIFNLGNIADSVNGQFAMAARAMVMGETLLNAEFIFPGSEGSSQYKASGTMEPVNFVAFNPMLVPSGGVKVNEGRITRFEFDFTYDNNSSNGNLNMDYQNLDITILDKEDGSRKKIKTFVAETFVLNKNNQKEDNSYREGNISFERNKKKSIFNYWWKSLFSGIKDVLAF